MLRYTFLFLNLFLFADALNIQPGGEYHLKWDNSLDTQVNLGLDININGSWISHTKGNNDFLSVILDNSVGEYDWHIPTQLQNYWDSDSRIKVTDMNTDNIILEQHFNFYGLTFEYIEDTIFNSTIEIRWNTNIDKNVSLSLIGNQIAYLIEENFEGNKYKLHLPNLPEGNYYIQISNDDINFFSNEFHISEFLIQEDNDDNTKNKDGKVKLCIKNSSCKYPLLALIIVICVIVVVFLYCCCCK